MGGMTVPVLELNNGVTMPALGFGVFQTPPDETIAAVTEALTVGYRHIDTAAAYFNEREVGEGIRRSGSLTATKSSSRPRSGSRDFGYDATLHAFDKSAGKLGVEQLDLLILHQALPTDFELTLEAYRALETLLADGKVRAIGVSNFMREHLDALMRERSDRPVDQPDRTAPHYFLQVDVQAADAERGILTQAWSPIGGITFYRETGESVLTDATIGAIASVHGKSPAQVMLRWHLQQGRSAIPKSTNPKRIAENFDVFDFELTDDELASIDALDRGVRRGPEPEAINLEKYGRAIPEA